MAAPSMVYKHLWPISGFSSRIDNAWPKLVTEV